MDFWATKTHGEREDEEADRLVRPSPRKKPPRRDRRRERIDADPDPDLKSDQTVENDPDLSLNYKKTAWRVFSRYVLSRSQDNRIPAWSKREKRRVSVSPETLKEHSELYEPYKGQDKEEGGDEGRQLQETGTALRELAQSDEALTNIFKALLDPRSDIGGLAEGNPDLPAKTLFPKVELPPGAETIGDLVKALQAVSKPGKKPKTKEVSEQSGSMPEPEARLKEAPAEIEKAVAEAAPESVEEDVELTDAEIADATVPPVVTLAPDSKEFRAWAVEQNGVRTDAKGNLLFRSGKGKRAEYVPFDDLSESEKSDWLERNKADQEAARNVAVVRLLGDLDPNARRALQDAANPYSELGKAIRAKGTEDIDPERAIPALKGKLPPNIADVQTLLAAVEQVYKPPPPPQRRAMTPEELREARNIMLEELPPSMYRLVPMDMHPDDVRVLVRAYQAVSKNPPGPHEREAMISFVKETGYYTDPNAVPPPEKWKNKPFRALSSEEQARAMQEYRMQRYAQSLVVRGMVTQDYQSMGMPASVASAVADYQLGRPKLVKPEKAANMVYEETRTNPTEPPPTPEQRKALLEATQDDPFASQIVAAYLQAQDYHAAKNKYLEGNTEASFSEHSSPSVIAGGLIRATRELRQKAEDYREAGLQHDVAREFRNRVLDRLRTLNPDKYAQVKAKLQEVEAREYDALEKEYKKALAAAEKDKKRYDSEVKAARARHKKLMAEYKKAMREWQAAVQKQLAKNNQGPYRVPVTQLALPEPPQPPEDPVKAVRPPKQAPPKPERPLVLTKYLSDAEAKEERRKLFSKEAAVSSYATARVMRISVYHGIQPPVVKPYPEWSQAQLRDFGKADRDALLASARKWLESHFLTANYEGAPPDVRLRAALDLAIRTFKNGAYSAGLPPPLYEDLLRNLAEVGTGETLLTQRESSYAPTRADTGDKIMTMPKFSAEQANRILTRLDKLAHIIQTQHEAWGMPFDAAKNIVNDLDRTADEIEIAAFGKESFEKRRAEVILKNPDEPYMDTFDNPMQPHQTDADEPYMAAYKDDQSSAVSHGEAGNGRPLAP